MSSRDLATLRPPVSNPADRVDFPEDFLATAIVAAVLTRAGGIECDLGRVVRRCHLIALAGTLRESGECPYRHQPGQVRQVRAGDRLRVISPEEAMADARRRVQTSA